MNDPINRRTWRLSLASLVTAALCLSGGAQAQIAAGQQRTTAPERQRPVPQPAVAPAPVAQRPVTQGLAADPVPVGGEVIARVGNANISAAEVRTYIRGLGAREQAALAKDPALLSQTVRMLLANRLVLEEVASKKWDQQPAVAAQLERVREGALAELYLQSVSTPPADFPSNEEVQKVYEANRSALLMPRQFQLAQIFVALPKDADKTAEEKAKAAVDAIQRKLKAPGADFAAIASSPANDAKDGGDLGWVVEGQIRPEIQAEIAGLSKNAVSDPVRLDDGWHIIKLVDTKAAYTRTLPEVRDQLVQQMRAERAAALRRTYLAELLKQHPAAVNELALSKVLDEQNQSAR